MIKFFPVVKLRELGLQIERKNFEELCIDTGFDSVERTIAGVFYRFFCDKQCPALFIKYPKKGEEVVPGLVWAQDYTSNDCVEIIAKVHVECASRYGYDMNYWIQPLNEKVMLIVKQDFEEGDWSVYGFDYAGKDGVSIPT